MARIFGRMTTEPRDRIAKTGGSIYEKQINNSRKILEYTKVCMDIEILETRLGRMNGLLGIGAGHMRTSLELRLPELQAKRHDLRQGYLDALSELAESGKGQLTNIAIPQTFNKEQTF